MGRSPRVQRAVTVVAISAAFVASCMLLYLTNRYGTYALHVGAHFPFNSR
jgi:multicomponent Na+:H+ antiporter subunit D